MKNNRWLMVAVLLPLGTLACLSSQSSQSAIQTAIAQTEAVQPTLAPTATPPPALLYFEDFSDPLSGWQVGEDPYDPMSFYNYTKGEYHVGRLKGLDLVNWAFARQDFDEAVVSVDIRHVSGDPLTTSAAVFWRITQDYSSYYALFINGDGQFSVTKYSDNVQSTLHDWETSSAIVRGQKVNHLDIYFADDLSIIYINGMRVAVFNDSASLRGDIALGAASSKTSDVDIAFDNLAVHTSDWVPSDSDNASSQNG
jgi:hypothetical protein